MQRLACSFCSTAVGRHSEVRRATRVAKQAMCCWGINWADCFGAGILNASGLDAGAGNTCLRQATLQFDCGTIATLKQEIAGGRIRVCPGRGSVRRP